MPVSKVNPDHRNGCGEARFEQSILEYVAAQRRQARTTDPKTQEFLDIWISATKPVLQRYARIRRLSFSEEFARIASTFRG
jgi:hypothetical protein